jgi:hypothetical protein
MPREPKPDHLSLVDARTGAVVGAVPSGLPPPPPGGAPDGFAVAPAGGRAAAAFPGGQRGRTVVLYALSAATATGAPAASLALPWIGLRRMAFDPEGRRLALAGAVVNDPRVVPTLTTIVEVRDTRDGAPVWAARFDSAASFQSLAWGGVSGGTVALGLPGTGARGEMGDRVVALDSRTGARRWTARWPSASVDGLVAFSPDGRLLAAASHGREMRLLDAATGETLLAVGGLRETRAVAWGPAGPRLLLAFNDGPRTRVIELTR